MSTLMVAASVAAKWFLLEIGRVTVESARRESVKEVRKRHWNVAGLAARIGERWMETALSINGRVVERWPPAQAPAKADRPVWRAGGATQICWPTCACQSPSMRRSRDLTVPATTSIVCRAFSWSRAFLATAIGLLTQGRT